MDGQARIVWKLARNHSWGTPMDAETLIRLAATEEDHAIAIQARDANIEYVVSFDWDFTIFDLVTLPAR